MRYGVNLESLILTDAAGLAGEANLTAESAPAVARPPHREVNPSCASIWDTALSLCRGVRRRGHIGRMELRVRYVGVSVLSPL